MQRGQRDVTARTNCKMGGEGGMSCACGVKLPWAGQLPGAEQLPLGFDVLFGMPHAHIKDEMHSTAQRGTAQHNIGIIATPRHSTLHDAVEKHR